MSVTLPQLIGAATRRRNEAATRLQRAQDELAALRDHPYLDEDMVRTAAEARDRANAEHQAADDELTGLLRSQDEEDQVQRAYGSVRPTGASGGGPARELAPATGAARQAGSAGPAWVRSNDGQSAVVERGQRFAEHAIVARHSAARAQAEQAVIGQHGGIANMVRAMTTSTGSAIVPTIWAGQIIDRARNESRVLQAGAEIVPMDAKVVQIGRLTGDPTAAFRTEGSTITASDPTFDNVTLTTQTMSALTVGSLEWFQDADNADQLVMDAIAKAIALQLDLVALYGSITSGAGSISLATPPNPRGVLGTLLAVASSSVLGAATNGTAQTTSSYWNEILDLVYTVRDYNEDPNALIWNSKAARQYAKAYDTTGQPLAIPADVAAIPRLMTNQVPSYTQGTMTSRATDVFAGDWRQMLIGQRLDVTIQVLTERYAENGQVGIVAHWRGDVQLARPRAFAVYRALQGA